MKQYLERLTYLAYAKSDKNLSQFRDIHQGESCYVIGDGASLKWFDLSVFQDKPTFVLCFLFLHKEFKGGGHPLYAPFNSPFYFYPYNRLSYPPHTVWRNHIQARYRSVIKTYSDTQFFVNLSNYPVLRGNNVHYFFKSIPGFAFIDNCLKNNIDPFLGGFRAAINLAIFMGFSEIVLVGCDYTHTISHSGHWYEHGPGRIVDQSGYNKEFFELATQYVDIVTVTREGTGKYLPSVEYETYAGKHPIYSENTDLLTEDDFRVLATSPTYKMFPEAGR